MTPAEVLAGTFPESDAPLQTMSGFGCQDRECECRKWIRYQYQTDNQARGMRLPRVVRRAS